jgi:protein-S-isoprenylcysteine O-methyltransferase Ste14
MLKRLSIFAYGLICYAVFFATFLYALGFVGNFLVPRSIDGEPHLHYAAALLVDLALLGVFAIQHSLMARPFFKKWLTQFIPASAERSTYVLFSSVALIALFIFWEPVGGMVWEVGDPLWRVVLYSLFGFGWGLVLISTFLINHFDLFGLRQIWLQLRGQPYTSLQFGTPGPYKLIRHPLYLGWLFAFWATPTMSVTHLVFALATTTYILIAIQLEERDLIGALGDDYRQYRARVPMIVPFLRTARSRPQPEVAGR